MPKAKQVPVGAVRFISKYNTYFVVEKPTVFTVENGIRVVKKGKIHEFVNGEYITDNPATIEFLRKHPAFGIDFFEDK